MRKWILALSLSIAACSGGKTGSSNNANNNGNGNGNGNGGNGSGSPTALTVHEWGTFTSMAGSGGQSLEGLHHEEVPLPAFVHARAADGAAGMKGLEQQPSG